MRDPKFLVVCVGVLLITVGSSLAAVPLHIPVQGVLRDNAGVPVVEDVFEMTFSLYETADAVDPLWQETWAPADDGDCATTPETCVHVQGGLFRVGLGTHAALSLDLLKAAPGLWLGVSVETDPELPRRPLGSAPYALYAQDAVSASSLDCSGCVALEMLGPGVAGHIVEEALQDVSALGYVTAEGAVQAVEDAGYTKQSDLVVSQENLPGNGLNEISNGLLSNEFIHTFVSAAPVDIKDDFPPGVFSTIEVADVGTVQTLLVAVDITNSDLPTIVVTLYDPNGDEYTLLQAAEPGDHLVATYPVPDAILSGDLTAWHGQNPAGEWILQVVDDGFKDNGLDGQIVSWSIEVDTLSTAQIEASGDVSVLGTLSVAQGASVAGDLEVGGTITGPGGIVVGASEAPCDAEHAGAIRFDPEAQRLTFCTGTELLQLKACSTDCPSPEEVTCGQPVQNGCDGPCEGTGTALDPIQCLSKVSTTPCGETVVDGCGNPCEQTGTALNLDTCPTEETIACGDPLVDGCGNVCGTAGTAYEPSQCPDAVTIACAVPVTDQCGNGCGALGSLCAGLSVCGETGCLDVGQGAVNPGASCVDIVSKGAATGDGVYWIDPDGPGGEGAFEVWCDMSEDGGGWTLVLMLQQGEANGFDFSYSSSQWSSPVALNPSTLDPTIDASMKSPAYATLGFSVVRLDMGTLGNSLTESIDRSSALSLFTGGHVSSSYSRGDFFAWLGESSSNWDSQPHCNSHGFNVNSSSAYCRYGISMNNENTCNSNDSWVGFGCHSQSCGGHSWTPSNTFYRRGWVFVR